MHKRVQQQKQAAKTGNKAAGMSLSWKSLIGTVDLLLKQCSTFCSEDLADAAQEVSRELTSTLKGKFNHPQRIQAIELLHSALDEYITVLCSATTEQQESIEFTPLIESLYTAALSVLGETIDAAGGVNKSTNEKQKQSEYEVIGLLQLLESLIGSSISQSTAAQQLFLPHYIPIVHICIDLAVKDVRSYEVRNLAVKIVETLIDIDSEIDLLINKDNKESKDLIQFIIDHSFTLCSDANDELVDPEEFAAVDLGTELLDAVLQVLNNNQTVVIQCLDRCKSIVSTSNATTQRHQIKGAVSIMGVLPDYIVNEPKATEYAKSIQTILTPLLSSNDTLLLGTAYVTEAEVIEYLYQPADVASIVPMLLSNISTTLQNTKQDIAVRIKATLPLSKLLSHIDYNDSTLHSTLTTAIQFILQQASSIIKSKKTQLEDAELVESYLLVLRAALVNTHKHQSTYMQSHLDAVITLMNTLLQQNDELFYGCRANATLIYAELCELKGAEWTSSILQSNNAVSKHITDNYSVPHYGIRAATHAFYAKAVIQVKSDIVPHLETIVDGVERVLDINYSISDRSAQHDDSEEDEEEDEYDEEDDEGEEEEDDPEDITAERTCALLLYRSLIESLKTDFVSYNNKLFATLFQSARDYDEEIRADVCQVLSVIPQLCSLPTTYQPAVTHTLTPDSKQLLKQTLQLFFFFIHYSSESEYVTGALNGLTKFLSQTGQTPLVESDRSIDTLVQLLKTLLQGHNLCQQAYGSEVPKPAADDLVLKPDVFGIDVNEYLDDEGDESDDSDAPVLIESNTAPASNAAPAVESVRTETAPTAAADELVDQVSHLSITAHTHSATCGSDCKSSTDTAAQPQPLETAIVDCIIQVAKIRGALFESALTKLYPAIKSTFDNEKYHSYSIGAMGEIALAVGGSITQYTKELLPLLFDRLRSKIDDPLVARFCSYTLGTLALKSNSNTFSGADIQQSETLLINVYNKYKSSTASNENNAAAADNAISAIARLVMSYQDQLQVNTTIPVLLSGLPLKVDFSELNSSCAAVVKLVNTLPKTRSDVYNANKVELQRVLQDTLALQQANPKLKEFVSAAVKQLTA